MRNSVLLAALFLPNILLANNTDNRVLMTGLIIDEDEGHPVIAQIILKGKDTDLPADTFNTMAGSGRFRFEVNPASSYVVTVEREGYIPYTDLITIPKGSQQFKKDIAIQKIVEGAQTVVRAIFFEPYRSKLLPESYETLDNIAEWMQELPEIKIEVQGHTDTSGWEDMNKKISRYRANSVRKYLISKGIEESRLTANGYGQEQPIESNETAEGRAKNRRVEFKIVGGVESE